MSIYESNTKIEESTSDCNELTNVIFDLKRNRDRLEEEIEELNNKFSKLKYKIIELMELVN